MYSSGARPFGVFSFRARWYSAVTSAWCVGNRLWVSRRKRLAVASLLLRYDLTPEDPSVQSTFPMLPVLRWKHRLTGSEGQAYCAGDGRARRARQPLWPQRALNRYQPSAAPSPSAPQRDLSRHFFPGLDRGRDGAPHRNGHRDLCPEVFLSACVLAAVVMFWS
jgi:hypothetical protein